MARQVTIEAAAEFMAGRKFKKSNTEVRVEAESCDLIHLYYQGNLIAKRYIEDGKRVMMVSNAGWFSNTTKERLNGIPGVQVNQKAFVWYLNGKEWDGGWTEV